MPPRPPAECFTGISPKLAEYITRLEHLVERLLDVVQQQSRVHEAALRAAKRQATPFRRDKKKRVRKHKKPGRKGGHEQARRAVPQDIDEEHEAVPPASCPRCDGRVEEIDSYSQTQEDIEKVHRRRRFTVHVGQCVDCGFKVHGRHPLQTSTARGNADVQVGPRALALAAQLHYGEGVPFDKVRAHLADLGLKVDRSTLVRAMDRVALRGMATFEALLDRVLQQDVLHIDETGWSVAGEPCWLWVLSGPEATVYFVRETRSSDEVADFLADFTGVLVTDGAKAYDKLGKTLTRALCLLHLRRNAQALQDKQIAGAVRFPAALIRWLDEAIDFVATRDPGSPAAVGRAVRLEGDLDRLLEINRSDPANARMVERLRTWRDAVIRCLRHPSVPATNNHGERMIRPAVVTRKRGGCNRSPRGARTFEVITSLLVSTRQQQVNFVDWLVHLLRQPYAYAPAPFW